MPARKWASAISDPRSRSVLPPAIASILTAGSPCVYSLDTTYNLGTTTPTTNGYTDQTITNLGTSFSAPIVSGIAALMLAVNGNLKSSELIARLQEGAKPFPQTSLGASGAQPPACHVPTGPSDNTQDVECICTLDDMTCGAGMANASGAVTAALRPIAAVAVPASLAPGMNVTLQGAGSAAACHHAVGTYAWSIVNGTTSGISGANTDTAVVVAPSSGSFTVRLTVTDDAGRQDTANVTVSSNAATTTAETDRGCQSLPERRRDCLARRRLRIAGERNPTSRRRHAGLHSDGHRHHQHGSDLAGE